jgi:DNA-binding NtrC family response regulator
MTRPPRIPRDERHVAIRCSDPDADALVAVPTAGIDLEALERALIAFALETTGGNRSHAARFLGLTRSALLYRMHKHHLAAGRTVA